MNVVEIKKALETIAHSNLYELVHAAKKDVDKMTNPAGGAKIPATQKSALLPLNCSEPARTLAYDIVTNIVSTYKSRGLRLKLSMRQLCDATE